MSIQAWESQDFLGDLMMCMDSGPVAAARVGTGVPADILNVHMYTPAQTIIDWMNNHPGNEGPSSTCQLLVRYSPFNNFPDKMAALGTGVIVDISTMATATAVSLTPRSTYRVRAPRRLREKDEQDSIHEDQESAERLSRIRRPLSPYRDARRPLGRMRRGPSLA